MQKILHFEFGIAIKDRPKIFQVITFILFAFSLTMILLGAFDRITSANKNQQVMQDNLVNRLASVASSSPSSAERIQK